MGNNVNKLVDDVRSIFARSAKKHPRKVAALNRLQKEVFSDGALSKKTKELIALAVALALRCEWCITYHVKTCLDLGSTPDEIEEAAWVASFMTSAPSTIYHKYVGDALDEFAPESK